VSTIVSTKLGLCFKFWAKRNAIEACCLPAEHSLNSAEVSLVMVFNSAYGRLWVDSFLFHRNTRESVLAKMEWLGILLTDR
jgi:hypothetical protein